MAEEPTSDFEKFLFDVRRSVRYHDRRVSFFESFHRLVLFLAVIAGSAAIATFTAQFAQPWPQWLKLLPAALISVLAGLDLVVGTTQKARLHDRLKSRFIALERTMQLARSTDDVLNEWIAERLMIEESEPPVLRILDTLCHNEMLRSMDYPKEKYIPVGPIQRFFSPFCDLGADALKYQCQCNNS